MAEATSPNHQNQRQDNYQRGRGYQNRPPYRGRGRGRGQGDERFFNVRQTLDDLGVSDLREHLNRKHQTEQGTNLQRSNSYTSKRGKKPQSQEPNFIHNPLNIKIQLSTSTGQRNYSYDDSVLPNIRHIPDHQYSDLLNRNNASRARGRNVRARGRGTGTRAKSTERKYNEEDTQGARVRSKSVESRGEYSNRGNYRGRGSHSRGRDVEFRGRGRGRGRNSRRGRGNMQNNVKLHSSGSHEVAAEENWDDEEGDSQIQEKPNQSNEEAEINEYEEQPNEENQKEEGDYKEDMKDKEKGDYKEEEICDAFDEKVVIEDNLVVTSMVDSSENKGKKRMVRFKDDEVEDDKKEETNINETKG